MFQSRADQAASHLRRKIKEGYWQHQLPAQRLLARELGISRRSLSAALAELEREGLIDNRRQGGTHIIPPKGGHRLEPLSVGVVFSSAFKVFTERHLTMLETIRQIFQSRRIRTEVHFAPQLRGNRVSDRFKKLVEQKRHHCWILNAPTESMQMWCAKNSIPAVVLGVGHESSGLSSVGVDHFALGRHAAGEMLRKGHRRIALILPGDEKGEDIESRLGLLHGVHSSGHPDARVTLEHHDQTIAGVCRLADRLLNRESRPTAWLICRQGHFLTIFSHLLHQKIAIPEEVSLISRDSDIYLTDIVPEPTRYVANFEFMARQCARKVLKVMDGTLVSAENLRVVPDFAPGKTLGDAFV